MNLLQIASSTEIILSLQEVLIVVGGIVTGVPLLVAGARQFERHRIKIDNQEQRIGQLTSLVEKLEKLTADQGIKVFALTQQVETLTKLVRDLVGKKPRTNRNPVS